MSECGLPLPCESTVASDSNALTITNSGDGSAIAAIATSERAAVLATNTSNGAAIFGSTTEKERLEFLLQRVEELLV
jgi:hypothetical protein